MTLQAESPTFPLRLSMNVIESIAPYTVHGKMDPVTLRECYESLQIGPYLTASDISLFHSVGD